MANDRLREAMRQAGVEPQDLADQVQADVKTVERWLSGRTPYPRLRTRIARALNVEPHELWPETATAPVADDEPSGTADAEHAPITELGSVPMFASPTAVGAPGWHELLDIAQEQIDLLDLTLDHVINTSDVVHQLAAKATAGCAIRILISDPESIHLTVTSAERDPSQTLTGRSMLAGQADHTLELLNPILGSDNVEVRLFVAPGYNTIIRADEQMLVSPHLWGVPVSDSPLIHLHANQQAELFEQFADHYKAAWKTARSA